MTRPPRNLLLITIAAALVACGGGFFAGRAVGEQKAPGLAVQRVEPVDRPKVGPQVPAPTPIAIPATLP